MNIKNLVVLLFLFSYIFMFSCRGEDEIVQFEIKTGEKVSTWCGRLEEKKILDCNDLLSYTKENADTLNEYRFDPSIPRYSFEGLFRPGINQIRIPSHLRKKHRTEHILAGLLGESERSLKRLITNSYLQEEDSNSVSNSKIFQISAANRNPYSQLNLSLYEEMILASIVEKEAASNREYNGIASVFLNRLTENRTLGSCPTVEYALGYHRPFLLRKDIMIDSPYNVYLRKGLPPTPIAFFSDEAFLAVHNPIRKKDNFFVFDWTTGDVHFSQTIEEHEEKARVARGNFIRKFGRKKLMEIQPNRFYEM